MKTKEFIEMLQKEDPSGEGYIRLYGGVPKYAESKAGYWDGPYQYIDKEGNFVTSISGYKVDIRCVDLDEFVSNLTDMDNPQNWEEIEKKIRFEFGGYANSGQREEKEKAILESARTSWEEMLGIQISSFNRSTDAMIKNAKDGWSWFQNKLIDSDNPNMHHYYTWKIYDKNGKVQASNPWNTEGVQKSGKWKKLDNGVIPGYYQWILEGTENIKPTLPIVVQPNIFKRIKKSLGIK